MGPVVEPDCKNLTGKLRGKKLLNSQRMSRGEIDTDLGNQGAEREKVSNLLSYNNTIHGT